MLVGAVPAGATSKERPSPTPRLLLPAPLLARNGAGATAREGGNIDHFADMPAAPCGGAMRTAPVCSAQGGLSGARDEEKRSSKNGSVHRKRVHSPCNKEGDIRRHESVA